MFKIYTVETFLIIKMLQHGVSGIKTLFWKCDRRFYYIIFAIDTKEKSCEKRRRPVMQSRIPLTSWTDFSHNETWFKSNIPSIFFSSSVGSRWIMRPQGRWFLPHRPLFSIFLLFHPSRRESQPELAGKWSQASWLHLQNKINYE